MNNPCDMCLVNPMCKKECEDLEEYMRELVPTHLRDYDALQITAAWLRASNHNEKINDIRVIFNASIKNCMFLELHPTVNILISKGKITKMRSYLYPWPKKDGFNSYRYSKPGFEITITHKGLGMTSKSPIHPDNLK